MSGSTTTTLKPAIKPRNWLEKVLDSDIWYSFKRSKVTIVAFIFTFWLFAIALLAPWIAPHNPFDVASLSLMDSQIPPIWIEGGDSKYLLGTDEQGRDMLSAMIYGLRISLSVGFMAVALGATVGITLGLLAGYLGGKVDTLIMRIADVQLSFPAILVALLIDGAAHAASGGAGREKTAFTVLVISIGFAFWVQYARTVRGSVLVEKNKDYVHSARLIGLSSFFIMLRHVLPNVLGPVLVIATINLALAIITEATLSFLGVGLPPTQPSIGTLIRTGNNFLFSGQWWNVLFPGVVLATLVLSVNLLGDWLRDALNPKLR